MPEAEADLGNLIEQVAVEREQNCADECQRSEQEVDEGFDSDILQHVSPVQ